MGRNTCKKSNLSMMKRISSMLLGLSAILLCSFATNAQGLVESITYNNIIYHEISADDATVKAVSLSNAAVDNVEIPSKILNKYGKEFSVKIIGSEFMLNNSSVQTLKIGEGIEDIEEKAFYGCSLLSEVAFPSTLRCIGKYAFLACEKLTEIVLPENLEQIGPSCFSGCTSLNTVNFGEKLYKMGAGVFERTPWLDNHPEGAVYCGNVFYAFKGVMTEGFTLKPTTRGIVEETFMNPQIKTLTIPDSIKWIGSEVFGNCSNLETINFPDFKFWCNVDLESPNSNPKNTNPYANVTFGGEPISTTTYFEIPESVKKLKPYILEKLEFAGIIINHEIDSVDFNAFLSASMSELILSNVVPPLFVGDFSNVIKFLNKISLYVPYGTADTYMAAEGWNNFYSFAEKAIGENGLYYDFTSENSATLIKYFNTSESSAKWARDNKLVIPETITSNGHKFSVNAIDTKTFFKFAYCDTLEFPASIKEVGRDAFYMSNWKVISIPDIDAWFGIDFPNGDASPLKYCEKMKVNGEYLEHLKVPKFVTAVPDRVFRYGRFLKSVEMSDDVTSIGYSSFYKCENLESVKLSANLKFIDAYAFRSPNKLKEIYLPAKLDSIGKYSFNIDSLKNVYSMNPVPPKSEKTNCFNEATELSGTLYVPVGSAEAYRNSIAFKNFVNIVEMDFSGVETIETSIETADTVRVFADGENIVIEGVEEGTPVEVFNLNGQTVYSGVETLINVADKGIYIVRVDGRAYKVAM